MAKAKLNTAFEAAIKRSIALKRWNTSIAKWQWQNMRDLVWYVICAEVFPEFGIRQPKVGDSPEEVKRITEEWTAAKKAFFAAFDDGYTLESSNCGKHLADHGYVAKITSATIDESQWLDFTPPSE